MRILLSHNFYPNSSGSNVYFETLTKLLQDNGHAVRVHAL